MSEKKGEANKAMHNAIARLNQIDSLKICEFKARRHKGRMFIKRTEPGACFMVKVTPFSVTYA
jgi:hypothetical protein